VDGEKYLLPFIDGLGIPRISVRDTWRHAEAVDVFTKPAGQVFQPAVSPSNLRLAVWSDGTVLWGEGERQPQYFRSTVPPEAVAVLLGSVDIDRYKTPNNARFSAKTLWETGTVTAILDGDNSLFLCSQIEAMKRIGVYWYDDGREFRQFPCSEYTYEQFCEELPSDYSQSIHEYLHLRDKLQAIVPPTGKQVQLEETVRWILVTNDGTSIGDQVDKQELGIQ